MFKQMHCLEWGCKICKGPKSWCVNGCGWLNLYPEMAKNHLDWCSFRERTIEDVEVGDILENRIADMNVIVKAVIGDMICTVYEDNGRGEWNTKDSWVKMGWKIKQPEPEKKKTFEDVCDEVINKINKSNDTPLPPYVEHTIRCGFEQLRNILKGNI